MTDKKFNRVIPRARMPEGIELCKQNIKEFLEDAKLIIAQGRLSHAYISVQYALEELGKILIFRDKLAQDQSDPIVIKYEEAFSAHANKTEVAWRFLDPMFMTIYDEGVFEEGVWERGVWKEDTYAEYETRLDCAFVDFYAERWQLGRYIEKELLVDLINHIEEKIPNA